MSMRVEFELADLRAQPLGLQGGPDRLGALRPGGVRPPGAAQADIRNGVAVLPLRGILVQRPGLLTALGMATSAQQFTLQLRQAIADPSVQKILVDADTPGGSLYGIEELASEIYRAGAIKPVTGIANSLAASAGYWLLSQCSGCYVAPGGEVGGIGVASAHTDMSGALAAAGIKIKLISAGKYKIEGNQFGPLSPEGRAAAQRSVDAYYSMFVRAVARGRSAPAEQVRRGMGQGRVMGAGDAVKSGLVDGVMTFDQLLARMQSPRLRRGLH